MLSDTPIGVVIVCFITLQNCFIRQCAVIVLLTLMHSGAILGQDRLGTARERFKVEVDRGRNALLRDLEKKQKVVGRSGNIEAIEELSKEVAAFRESNRIPRLVPTLNYEKLLAREISRVAVAYEKEIQTLTRSQQHSTAQRVRQELSVFRDQALGPVRDRYVGEELIFNPSCEVASRRNGIPGWASRGAIWTYRSSNPTPKHGNGYFYAGPGPIAELTQDVRLGLLEQLFSDGAIRFEFEGAVRSYDQRKPDTTELVVEFLGQRNKLIKRNSTGKLASTKSWRTVELDGIIPKGTQSVRIRLVSIRSPDRGVKNNDGYFDNLSFKIFDTNE